MLLNFDKVYFKFILFLSRRASGWRGDKVGGRGIVDNCQGGEEIEDAVVRRRGVIKGDAHALLGSGSGIVHASLLTGCNVSRG